MQFGLVKYLRDLRARKRWRKTYAVQDQEIQRQAEERERRQLEQKVTQVTAQIKEQLEQQYQHKMADAYYAAEVRATAAYVHYYHRHAQEVDNLRKQIDELKSSQSAAKSAQAVRKRKSNSQRGSV